MKWSYTLKPICSIATSVIFLYFTVACWIDGEESLFLTFIFLISIGVIGSSLVELEEGAVKQETTLLEHMAKEVRKMDIWNFIIIILFGFTLTALLYQEI